MLLPDVNVLVHALRHEVPEHPLCKGWLDAVVTGDSHFALSRLVLSSAIRIATNQRLFKRPTSLEVAFGFCEDLTSQPHCRIVEPGEDHWRIYERLCRDTDTRGPRVTDAWLAALAIEHGCEWITLDRDFARFPGLKWRVPSTNG